MFASPGHVGREFEWSVPHPVKSVPMRAPALALAFALVLLVGCAGMPKEYPRTPSKAFPSYASTAIGAYFEKAAGSHPGQSGFAIFPDGRRAFTTRIAMTELAEKTLDLQYFIWDADTTGRILAERVVRAADRSVRVRILVDDLNLKGRDVVVAALDAHPNIEIRLFNPFAQRSAQWLDFIADFDRVNHRMHNKLFVMDNVVAVVGGRNIGNHYFEVHQQVNFRDLDVVTGGPVVREASGAFDHFWNSDWAVPIRAMVDRPATEADLRRVVQMGHERIAKDPYPYPLAQDVANLRSELTAIFDTLIWAPGHMIFDDPNEIKKYGRTTTMTERFFRRIERLRNELLIEVPYFVVRDRGLAAAKRLHERGVLIRVLTNSLASNDVLAAHAGHAEHRDELVAAGVELYELRADPAIKKRTFYLSGSAQSTLHNKVMVFDRKDVFIGSLNLDPRSGDINTEAGLYIESPELAAKLVAYMDEGVRPQYSYRVRLDADGDLYWTTETNGKTERYDHDPNSTAWQRAKVRFIRMLPVMNQL
ncbi:phospholipase D family protein [Methylotetracoccus oryzae]|uniref:phospholipase D family protein n=1 Tax=Methylotetracoccus oryzae TaxID=1919059 RepID=UPI0011182262|nr:phospholipase D family protein [Methylotetracoccus oryzae]